MKFLFIALFGLSLAFGCKKKEKESTSTTTFNTVGQTVVSTALFNGGGGHDASGTATLYDSAGVKTLVFSNFQTDNGPDVNVYLSSNATKTNAVLVGDLIATNGSFSYTLPAFDVSKRTVLLWCDQANVIFGTAVLP